MTQKILVIGAGAAVIHSLQKEIKDVVVVTPQESKGNPFKDDPTVFVKAPEIKTQASVYFPEPKNFINGKKLPKKYRRFKK